MGNAMSDTVDRARALFGPVRWDGPVMSESGQFVLPIGTVTLVLADVQGSTRQWEERPAEMKTALADVDKVVDSAVETHHGVRPVEQGEGDSFVAAFSKASDGLACALDIQRQLTDSPLLLRIGIHTGEVQLRDEGNYLGPALNRAARLRDSAHGGQVVLSQVVRDLVVDHLPEGANLKDLGSHRLRDLGRPEHIYQVVDSALPADFPPLRSLDSVPNNLPVQLTSFVGREPELAVLQKLLAETRMLTLTGAGGCGKTRLALELAARVLEQQPDGAWFVDLSAVTDPKAVSTSVAAAIGVRSQQGRRLIDTVTDHLGAGTAVILLDNCEHLVDASAEIARQLLLACPTLTVLATSREQLGVPGETPWLVPSLSIPSQRTRPRLDALGQYEAVRLFVDRARKARPNFTVSNKTAATVAAICQRLDGIPLAIELAAARSRVLSVEQILDGLDDRFRLLTGGARTAVPRQQTLRASVDWSYQLLSDDERLLLNRVSVFAGGFTLGAAEAVAGGGPIGELAVLDLLQSLVDKSLLIADLWGDQARYRMLETIRQFAAEQLEASGERDHVRDRHRAFYVRLAEQSAPRLEGDEQEDVADLLELDRQNMRAAFDHAHRTGDADSACQIVGALFWYWIIRGHVGESQKLSRLALELPDATPAVRAAALVGAAQLAQMRYDLSSLGLAEEALELARQSGARKTEGRACYLAGWATSLSDHHAGVRLIESGVAIARGEGDRWGLAMALLQLGMAHGSRPALSRPPLEESVAICLELDERYLLNTARYNLSRTFVAQGRTDEGEELLRAAIDHARRTGDAFSLSMAVSELGLVLALRGDFAEARPMLEGNAELFRAGRLPWTSQEVQAVGVLGSVLRMAGRLAEARPACEESLAKSREMAIFPDIIAMSLVNLARVEHELGDVEAANAHVAEALTIAEDVGAAWPAAVTKATAARLALANSDTDAAERLAFDALEMSYELGYHYWPHGAVDALETIAVLAGDPNAGARLLGAVDAAYQRSRRVRAPIDDEAYSVAVKRLREQLGDDGFGAASAEGGALSLDEAVEYARRGRGKRRRPSSGWESLTPTELEVVKLVAEGLSNPQIAERMFISRKTVTTHLSHVFAKLGLPSRSALSAEAVRQGVVLEKGEA
jgi:predicted ATPase/class 3 adenylate cyclase/DNA-binding CsgD family transcriptional regulator